MNRVLRFDGRVALVTGAGQGLGRAYALLLASRGATVVVNDLGCTAAGDASGQLSSKPVDAVVAEIQKNGGQASGNYESCTEGTSIINSVLKKHGRIDILVNNAGILRDKRFEKLTDDDWEQIHRVHLTGAYNCSKAVWPHMVEQKYGRIIMTSSASGIFGNYGQTNYAAAKSGLIGFAQALSKEGQKHGILVNTIVPMAASRMTENVMPPDLFKQLRPELIAPVVGYMCHESFQDTGMIIEAAGGIAARYQWHRTPTTLLRKTLNEDVTIESVLDNWNKICTVDPKKLDFPGSIFDPVNRVMEGLETMENTTTSISQDEVTKHNLVDYQIPDTYFDYAAKDAILYALSLGMNLKDKEGLNYLYENAEDFRVLPTFPVLASTDAMFNVIKLDGLNIDLSKILHGEQFVELHRVLPEKSEITIKTKVVDVMDKISGAAYVIRMEGEDRDGPLFTTEFLIFEAGGGKFGGKRDTDKPISRVVPAPSRKPDHIFEFKTNEDQAAMYRLNGDWNPLHIDSNFAALGGFERPILHGLCSFGIAARLMLSHYADSDPRQFKSIKVRFSKPVYPGQTLFVETWKEDNRIHFETKVKESGDTVLSGGYMDLAVRQDQQIKSKL